jgi:hypothetical protein
MPLNGKDKTYIINRMESLVDNSKGKIIQDTQIRKYASMASKSDCKEEFLNYMHYQIGRARNNEKNFLNKALDEVVNMEKQFENEEKYIEAIAFFFGYMARYKKYKDSIGGK